MPPGLSAGCLIQTTNKIKTQTQSSADRMTTSHSPAPQTGKTQHNTTQHNTATTHLLPPEHKHKSHPTQSLHKSRGQSYPPRAEIKRKKEFSLKAWDKETSNTTFF